MRTPKPLDTAGFLEYLGLIEKNRYIGDFSSNILGLTVFGNLVPIPSYDEMLRPVVLEESFGTVLISPILLGRKNKPRRRYTEMHEASHFILHRQYFKMCEQNAAAQCEYPTNFIACRNVEAKHTKMQTDSDWLEYQADTLAAALLMPRTPFFSCAMDIFRKNGIRSKYLTIRKNENNPLVNFIIQDLAENFFVSRHAARIRMDHLGLLRENSY